MTRAHSARKAKVAVTIPADVLAAAQMQVAAGAAPSLSAFVSAAVADKIKSNDLERLLDAMDAELGPPGPEAQAWAKRVLGL